MRLREVIGTALTVAGGFAFDCHYTMTGGAALCVGSVLFLYGLFQPEKAKRF